MQPATRFKIFVCACLAFIFTGCTTIVEPPIMSGRPGETVSRKDAQESWAQVLNAHVDEQGRIDFRGIADHPNPLYRYIAYVAQTSPRRSPERFPDRETQLEYYLNSYNALAMYGVIVRGFPKDFHRFSDRAGFFKLTEYRIGGKLQSLYDYENDVIRPLGDPRVHFALNCMVRACPRLPRTPFRARSVNEILDVLTVEFVNDPRHVDVLQADKKVRLSEIFRFYKEDFVGADRSPSLIAYINRYRKEPIAENFKVEFIDYDWTVNAQ